MRTTKKRPPVTKRRPAKVEPKTKGRELLGERRCVVCGAPRDGTYLWDIHVDPKTRELVDTCSPKCRVKGGYKERKATA
jgi:hypothetical protein